MGYRVPQGSRRATQLTEKETNRQPDRQEGEQGKKKSTRHRVTISMFQAGLTDRYCSLVNQSTCRQATRPSPPCSRLEAGCQQPGAQIHPSRPNDVSQLKNRRLNTPVDPRTTLGRTPPNLGTPGTTTYPATLRACAPAPAPGTATRTCSCLRLLLCSHLQGVVIGKNVQAATQAR